MSQAFKFILGGANTSTGSIDSPIYINCINKIQNAITKREIIEIYIATAFNFNYSNSKIQVFWRELIYATEITVHFIFRFDEQKAIDLDFLENTKDVDHIKWYPILKNLHTKIIYSPEIGGYIGSANMTEAGWEKNFEAGIWFDKLEDEQNKELLSYMDKLMEASYTQDKKKFYEDYKKCMEDCDKTNVPENSERGKIFNLTFPSKALESNSKNTTNKNFEETMYEIYDVFFTKIYPETEKYLDKLPKEWRNYPLNLVVDQLLYFNQRKEYEYKSIKEIIDNLHKYSLEKHNKIIEKYQEGYEILHKGDLTNIDVLKNLASCCWSCKSVSHYNNLPKIWLEESKSKESFQNNIRYLINQEDGEDIIKKYAKLVKSKEIKQLGKARIGEFIGMAQIQSSQYPKYNYPIWNDGVRKRILEIDYKDFEGWNS